MIAVHFGAGNIGRGFIGCLLNEAGYDLVFLDVNQEIVDELNSHESYRVIETGAGAKTHTVTGFRALNSQSQFDEAAEVIANAQVLTASVGVNVLKFLAPLIAAGLDKRQGEPLVIMACENAIGATDILRGEIEKLNSAAAAKAIYANTAVDRIVPPQKPGLGLDVQVEAFSEWAIDATALGGQAPKIPGAEFVSDLKPFIERKLFTVNTGHATLAYAGQASGAKTIVEALSMPRVREIMQKVLAETSKVLILRHGFDPAEHEKYVNKTIERFGNADLDDPVERVGRQPARKLSRHDRIIGPAAYLAEMGIEPEALLDVVDAALVFKDDSDPEVEALHQQLRGSSAEEFVSAVMGISTDHPLATKLTSHVNNVKLQNYS
jgi:mannitol-1-phosphate 5-dehydrogenase